MSGESIDTVNRSHQWITVRFSGLMERQCDQSSFYCNASEPHEDLQRSMEWVDGQTLVIRLNRPLYQDERVKFVLRGIFDQDKRPLAKPIVLIYEGPAS